MVETWKPTFYRSWSWSRWKKYPEPVKKGPAPQHCTWQPSLAWQPYPAWQQSNAWQPSPAWRSYAWRPSPTRQPSLHDDHDKHDGYRRHDEACQLYNDGNQQLHIDHHPRRDEHLHGDDHQHDEEYRILYTTNIIYIFSVADTNVPIRIRIVLLDLDPNE